MIIREQYEQTGAYMRQFRRNGQILKTQITETDSRRNRISK